MSIFCIVNLINPQEYRKFPTDSSRVSNVEFGELRPNVRVKFKPLQNRGGNKAPPKNKKKIYILKYLFGGV